MSRTHEYAMGSEVTVEVRFYTADENGDPLDLTDPDPATASIRWRHETDVAVSVPINDAAVTHVDTGVFAVQVTGDQVGKWHYRGESTAGLVCASPARYFTIEADPTR